MASNLDNQVKVLREAERELDAYTRVFNTTAESVISNTEAMGVSALELKDQLNKLLSDAKGLLGLNVSKANSRISAIGNTIKTAFYSGDIERARSLMGAYASEVDKLRTKIEGQSKAQDISRERQRQSQAEAEKTARAQQKAADEAQRASEREKKAYEDSLNAAKSKVQGVLSTIKSLADGVNNGVNKIVSIIRQGMNLITRIISGTIKFIGSIGSTVTNIIKLFGSLGDRVKSVFGGGASSTNIFKNSITELNSKITLLKNLFNAIFNNQMVAKAKNLMASVYSMKNIMGTELTQSVLDWANSMEYAFGLSARDLIGDINELTGVLYGLGMSAKDVAIGSENLLMISRYLGFMGAAGGDVQQVITKLNSGMKGMTQAIDDLGLSVREAQMDTYLKDLKKQGGEFANIATSFSSLNEQARVYVRYSSLISQFTSKYDLVTFASALDTVTGRLSILKQTVSSFTAVLGTGLAKIGAYLAGYLIPIIKRAETYVTSFFNWLSNLFGIDLDTSLNVNINGDKEVDNLNKGLSDTNEELEKVEDNAKKASGGLQSFDRVNNISTKNNSNSSESDFDYSKLMNTALDNLNAYAEEAESYFKKLDANLTNTLNSIKKKIVDIVGQDTVDKVKSGVDTIKEKLKQAFRVLTGKQTLDDVIQMNTDESWWGKFLRILDVLPQKISNVLKMIKQLISVILGAPSLDAIAEMNSKSTLGNILRIVSSLKDILGQLFDRLTEFINSEVIPWLKEKLGALADWLAENKDKIVDLLTKLGSISWDAFKIFVGLVAKLIDLCVKHPGVVVGFFSALLALKIISWGISSAAGIGQLVFGLSNLAGLFKSGGALAGLGVKVSTLFSGITTSVSTAAATVSTKVSALATSITASTTIGLAGIASLVAGVVKATDSIWKDGGLGYGVKTLFDSNLLRQEEINKWADKYYAYMKMYSEKTGASIDSLRQDTINAFKQSLENSGKYTYEQIETMMKQFENHLQSHIDKDISTWADKWFGNDKEAKEWAQSVWDSTNKVQNAVSNTTQSVGTSLDTLVASMNNSSNSAVTNIDNLASGVEKGNKRVALTLDELISEIKKSNEEVKAESPEIGKNIVEGIDDGLNSRVPKLSTKTGNIITNLINSVKNLLGIHSPSTVFSSIGTNIVEGLLNGIKNTWTVLTNSVNNMFSNLLNNIKTKVNSMWSTITGGINNLGTNITTTITNRTSAVSARKVTTNALGGSIAGGQLFIANEHGDAELIGNIDGSGKTNVANNNMIISAMQSGVFEAVYNAMAEIQNQRSNTGNVGNANIKIDGFGLIDQSTLRELARMLAPYLNSNNINIADTSFTI